MGEGLGFLVGVFFASALRLYFCVTYLADISLLKIMFTQNFFMNKVEVAGQVFSG